MAKKSLFNKFINLFSKPRGEKAQNTLSASQALNRQYAYITADNFVDSSLTPPYSEIVKQLYSSKDEIFAAALYYLQKIAANEPNQTESILAELSACLSRKAEILPQHKAQIEQTITEITKQIRD